MDCNENTNILSHLEDQAISLEWKSWDVKLELDLEE